MKLPLNINSRIKRALRPGKKVVREINRRLSIETQHQYQQLCFSQEGEDMILARIFHGAPFGFYVDIGAHHPQRFSNTYYFYLQGWSGINIDAMPGCMKAFDLERPRDINLELAIGNEEVERDYFIFNEAAFNSFDEELSHSRVSDVFYITNQVKVVTKKLSTVLDDNLPINQRIDFMSVDVEGLDLEVLKSNDWQRFRPEYVLFESYQKSMESIYDEEIYRFLVNQDYELFAKTVYTAIVKNARNSD